SRSDDALMRRGWFIILMMDRAAERAAPSFGGRTVVAFESRMAGETARLIERYGGRALVAPALSEAPLAENAAALRFAEKLIADGFDLVIFLTGVGTRELLRVIAARYGPEVIRAALGRTLTVARGPKPAAALREFGVSAGLTVAEPNTWREILRALDGAVAIAGKRVAIQEYGMANPELTAALEAREAEVTTVPVYRWTLPADRGPVREAIRVIAAGGAAAVLFTSSQQVTNVLQIAEAAGAGADLRRGLGGLVVASIGPICSARLRGQGIGIAVEPEHPKLGHLVRAAAGAVAARGAAASGAGAVSGSVADAADYPAAAIKPVAVTNPVTATN